MVRGSQIRSWYKRFFFFTFFGSGSLVRRLLPSPFWQLPRLLSLITLATLAYPWREMIFGLLSSTGQHQSSANTVPALYQYRTNEVLGTFRTIPVSIGCEDYIRLRFVDDLSSLAHKVQCRPSSFAEKTPPTRQDQQRNRYT